LDSEEEQETVNKKVKINKKKIKCAKYGRRANAKTNVTRKEEMSREWTFREKQLPQSSGYPCFTQLGGRTFHHSSSASLSFHYYYYYYYTTDVTTTLLLLLLILPLHYYYYY
jgi:hypothetical protein